MLSSASIDAHADGRGQDTFVADPSQWCSACTVPAPVQLSTLSESSKLQKLSGIVPLNALWDQLNPYIRALPIDDGMVPVRLLLSMRVQSQSGPM
mgnify:CR=1 FL=1